MFIQLFEGWRYRPGVRERLAGLGLGSAPADAPRPDVPGLIGRLLATESDDPDTGIGLWIWEDEAACRRIGELGAALVPAALTRLLARPRR